MSSSSWLARHRGGVSLAMAAGSLTTLELCHAQGWLLAPAWQVARHAAEGATVGGLADWFAVSALFCRIPIPLLSRHTNIVVKSRPRLVEGIVDMVQNQWLSPAVIRERLAHLPLTDSLLALLAHPDARRRAERIVRRLARRLVSELDNHALAQFLDSFLRQQLAALPLTPALVVLLRQLLEGAHFDVVWHSLLDGLDRALADTGFRHTFNQLALEALRGYEEEGRWNKLKAWLGKTQLAGEQDDEKVAHLTERVLARLHAELQTLRHTPDAPLRHDIRTLLVGWLARLEAGDVDFEAAIHAFQRTALAQLDTRPWLAQLLATLRQNLVRQLSHRDSDLNQLLAGLLGSGLAALADDAALRERVDGWCRHAINVFVEQNHDIIGDTVRLSLSPTRLPDATLVAQIENRVGHDLQWIPVNGATVGGTVAGLLAVVRGLVA